jgi:hypothetical protein
MRSAILQPDVPSHVFPTSKTTESSNVRPGKPVSKRASSKAKPGSKRRASETGFDEFNDAGINDDDLALAENGGFENIDDFDDEPRPSASTSRKKQGTSTAHDEEITTHEPRQLANGKWACNHNCKDKTSCKHLCCREGLDKKPKPPKAKTSKKEAENAVDPKQTQLSLSVSKKSKAPAATQLLHSQQLAHAPAPDRNPPKCPEMHKLNTLHNNAKSNTQPVPLSSTAGSRMKSFDPSVTLLRPGQPRSKTTESARRAAQNVYSDDFGDIDDMSLFDEPTAHHPDRLSPPLETESDLFTTDLGDMLDDYSPANKDKPISNEATAVKDNQVNDSSLYDVDEDMLLPLERAFNDDRQSEIHDTQQGAGRSAGPLVEVSDESAILNLGSRANDQGSSSTTAKTPSGYETAVLESHILSHDNAFNSASEERPASSDSAMKACMEELGTDFFNFTG